MLQNSESKLANLKEKKAEEIVLSKILTSINLLSTYLTEINLAKNANEATAIAKKADLEYSNVLQIESTVIASSDPVVLAKIKAADTMRADCLTMFSQIIAKTTDAKTISDATNIISQINNLWNNIQFAYNVNQATGYAREISTLQNQLKAIKNSIPTITMSPEDKAVLEEKTKFLQTILTTSKNNLAALKAQNASSNLLNQVQTSIDAISNALIEINNAQNANEATAIAKKADLEYNNVLKLTATIIPSTDTTVVEKTKALYTTKYQSVDLLNQIRNNCLDDNIKNQAYSICSQINDLLNQIQIAYEAKQATTYADNAANLFTQLSSIYNNLPAIKVQKIINDQNKALDIRKIEDSLTPYMFAQIKISMDKITNYLSDIKFAQNDNDAQAIADKAQEENKAILKITNLNKNMVIAIMLDISYVKAIIQDSKRFISVIQAKSGDQGAINRINQRINTMLKYLEDMQPLMNSTDSKNISNKAKAEYLAAADDYIPYA